TAATISSTTISGSFDFFLGSSSVFFLAMGSVLDGCDDHDLDAAVEGAVDRGVVGDAGVGVGVAGGREAGRRETAHLDHPAQHLGGARGDSSQFVAYGPPALIGTSSVWPSTTIWLSIFASTVASWSSTRRPSHCM